jgi:hypothetical protein
VSKVIVCSRDQGSDEWVRQEGEFGRVPVVGEYISDPETLAWHHVLLVAHVPASPHAADFVAEVFVGRAENPVNLLEATALAAEK